MIYKILKTRKSFPKWKICEYHNFSNVQILQASNYMLLNIFTHLCFHKNICY